MSPSTGNKTLAFSSYPICRATSARHKSPNPVNIRLVLPVRLLQLLLHLHPEHPLLFQGGLQSRLLHLMLPAQLSSLLLPCRPLLVCLGQQALLLSGKCSLQRNLLTLKPPRIGCGEPAQVMTLTQFRLHPERQDQHAGKNYWQRDAILQIMCPLPSLASSLPSPIHALTFAPLWRYHPLL